MNIFAFDSDPWLSAKWLDDVRKNKMILETAQLLSSSVLFNDPFTSLPVYKPTHTSHPCTRWARKSRANFGWLVDYMHALGVQKAGPHKSMSLLRHFEKFASVGNFMSEELTPFANCARNKDKGLDFTHVEDTHQAYRLYICERWKERKVPLTWKWGAIPDWKT